MVRDSDHQTRFDELVAASPLNRAEARTLLAAASGRPREWLIAHGDEPAPAEVISQFRRYETDRSTGTPIAYLIGKREFFGRCFRVTPAVLIPRIETEMLVSLTIERAPQNSRIIELGTGSGAIAVSIALKRPDLTVIATDLSEQALAVARLNARHYGARVQFLAGSWWSAVDQTDQVIDRFALMVSNPPYLAQDDEHLQLGDLRFEPTMALASGPSGLDAIATIIEGAEHHLQPGGHLLIEHGWQQSGAVQAAMTKAHLQTIESLQDDQGHWRVTTSRTPVHKTVV